MFLLFVSCVCMNKTVCNILLVYIKFFLSFCIYVFLCSFFSIVLWIASFVSLFVVDHLGLEAGEQSKLIAAKSVYS